MKAVRRTLSHTQAVFVKSKVPPFSGAVVATTRAHTAELSL